jgi:HK97 gp10 family phage protein
MMRALDVNVRGVEELRAKLQAITTDLQKKGGKSALRKAAKKIADQAKRNWASVDRSETQTSIEKNIAIHWSSKTARRTGDLAFRVGVIGGARQYVENRLNRRLGRSGGTYAVGGDIAKKGGGPGGDTFYWRFLEFGTSRIAAKKPMRNAADSAGQSALDAFVTEYPKEIDKAIKRAAKRAGR